MQWDVNGIVEASTSPVTKRVVIGDADCFVTELRTSIDIHHRATLYLDVPQVTSTTCGPKETAVAVQWTDRRVATLSMMVTEAIGRDHGNLTRDGCALSSSPTRSATAPVWASS